MSVELTNTANISGKVTTPVQIDRTLTKEYMCAEAKATGDAIRKIEEDNALTKENMSAELKVIGDAISEIKEDNALTKEYMHTELEATGNAIREITEDNAMQRINVMEMLNISSEKKECYKSGRICQFVVDFRTTETIIHHFRLYRDLPTPMVDIDFVVHTMDGVMYWLKIRKISETEQKSGICENSEQEIPSGTRLFGTVTYITTD